MDKGENEQGLRKILDLTRMISIATLLLHFYYYNFEVFRDWGMCSDITNRLLQNIYTTGLFNNFQKSKIIALLFLLISLIGSRGHKTEKIAFNSSVGHISIGLTLYFASHFLFSFISDKKQLAVAYIGITTAGFILVLTGGTLASRIVRSRLSNSVFNTLNETFPQEERLLNNEFSINLPARYNFKGKFRKSWINIINPFRGLLIMGSPGSGKSYFIIAQKIDLKAFCAEIINDNAALDREQGDKTLPVFSKVEPNDVLKTCLQVKKGVVTIVQTEIERMMNTPELESLIIRK